MQEDGELIINLIEAEKQEHIIPFDQVDPCDQFQAIVIKHGRKFCLGG